MLQRQTTSIRPLTTAHLAQTMTLLSLTTEELQQSIESELASNPALEMVEERRCPTCHRLLTDPGKCPVCSLPANLNSEEPVVFLSPREEFISRKDYVDTTIDDEPFAPEVEELPAYVLKQIAPDLDTNQRALAAVDQPAQMILVMDGQATGLDANSTPTNAATGYGLNVDCTLWENGWRVCAQDRKLPRHMEQNNIAFVDGHVKIQRMPMNCPSPGGWQAVLNASMPWNTWVWNDNHGWQ